MYSVNFPNSPKDRTFLADRYREYYRRFFPELIYRSLITEESVRDDVYGDGAYGDDLYITGEHGGAIETSRVFEENKNIHIQPSYNPEEQVFEEYMREDRRQVLFVLCVPLLDDASVTVKAGDEIVWDAAIYEVRTFVRSEETYFAHVDLAFEMVVVADRPNTGY